MSKWFGKSNGFAQLLPLAYIACGFSVTLAAFLVGGNNNGNNGFGGGAVGGIKVDAEGVLSAAPTEMKAELRKHREKHVKPAGEELRKASEMRMISVKNLEHALAKAGGDITRIPNELRFMAGIQRIEYVFLYPEENDIVLAGPGEGWTLDDAGNVVGVSTGMPVVRLEDFIVAMQTADNAREGYGISCSIDPTEEGRVQYRKMVSKVRSVTPQVIKRLESAMGMQQITLTGVPKDSRFARVLVAADYKMKRMAMELEPTPVKEIPGFLTMMKKKNGKLNGAMPRWWLACNYEPLSKSDDGLAWKINGPGVKAMTENELIGKDGKVSGTGRTNPIAQEWSDNMTKNYEKLIKAEPVFGDLRNVMDLAVVAALIRKEGMFKKVNLKTPTLANEITYSKFHVPSQVPTQCSHLRTRRATILTASGGVELDSWTIAGKSVLKDMAAIRKRAKPHGTTALSWN